MDNDLPEKVKQNIKKNFCGKNYYVEKKINRKSVEEQCKRCPPGKDDWYEELPDKKVRLTTKQLNQLKQCSGGDTVKPDLIRKYDANFIQTDPSGEPTWKILQKNENIKDCLVDPVTGEVSDNDNCEPIQPTEKLDENTDGYEIQFKRFTECVRKKVPLIEDEFTLVNELKRISSTTTEDCLDILPPQDICDNGYSELYMSVPSIYLQENGIDKLTKPQQAVYDRTMRQLLREAYDTEEDVCGAVSNNTISLNNISYKQLKDSYPEIPINKGISTIKELIQSFISFLVNTLESIGIWPTKDTSVHQLMIIGARVVVFSLLVYLIMKMTHNMKPPSVSK